MAGLTSVSPRPKSWCRETRLIGQPRTFSEGHQACMVRKYGLRRRPYRCIERLISIRQRDVDVALVVCLHRLVRSPVALDKLSRARVKVPRCILGQSCYPEGALDQLSFPMTLFCFVCGIFYIFARIYFVVETFISIRQLPLAAYATPD
jgi:hypothetical protein